MSMEYIRNYYRVPAKRGGRIEYTGGEEPRQGVITGSRGARILIRLDGDNYAAVYHPTWEIRYLEAEPGPTRRQLAALEFLRYRHEGYPELADIASRFLGPGKAAHLRKLVPLGLVTVTKGGRGSRQFFAITEAGRAKLKEATR